MLDCDLNMVRKQLQNWLLRFPLFCFLSTQTKLFIYNVTTCLNEAIAKAQSTFWKSPITQLVFTLANTSLYNMPSEQHNFTQEHTTHRHDCTVTQQAIMLHCFDLHPKKRHHCTVSNKMQSIVTIFLSRCHNYSLVVIPNKLLIELLQMAISGHRM